MRSVTPARRSRRSRTSSYERSSRQSLLHFQRQLLHHLVGDVQLRRVLEHDAGADPRVGLRRVRRVEVVRGRDEPVDDVDAPPLGDDLDGRDEVTVGQFDVIGSEQVGS